jgi:hypothetical protein
MTETYLQIEESLGYLNLRQAFKTVFGFFPENVRVTDFENFGFVTSILGEQISFAIGNTQKDEQFQFGEGGILQIALLSEKDEFGDPKLLWEALSDKAQADFVRYEGANGKSETSLEKTLQILKSYLVNRQEDRVN